jgi:hypothetical protein
MTDIASVEDAHLSKRRDPKRKEGVDEGIQLGAALYVKTV